MPDHNRQKFHFLPEARSGPPGERPVPPPPAGKYPCPCCGFLTFPVPKEQAIAYICPVCFWENDVFDPGEDDPSVENSGMTLREGREKFLIYGAVKPRFVQFVRKPYPEEWPM